METMNALLTSTIELGVCVSLCTYCTPFESRITHTWELSLACYLQQRPRELEDRWKHHEMGDGTTPFYLSPLTEGPNAEHFLCTHPSTITGCHAVCLW